MWREWSSARTFSQSTCSAFWQILAAPFGLRADQTWSVVPSPGGGKYPCVVSQHAENPFARQVRVFVHTVWGCIRAGRIGLRIWPSADCFLLAEAVQAGGHRWPEPSWVRNRRGRHCDGAPGDGVEGERTIGVRGRVGVRSARAASKFRAWTPRARPSARVPIATGIFPHPASSTRRCGEGAREIVGDARAWEDRIARWDRSAASA